MCFKCLCKCVFDVCCLNFFVLENNMFMYKVVGVFCEVLFFEFYDYYEISVVCLFFSFFLYFILVLVIYNLLFVKFFIEGYVLL